MSLELQNECIENCGEVWKKMKNEGLNPTSQNSKTLTSFHNL